MNLILMMIKKNLKLFENLLDSIHPILAPVEKDVQQFALLGILTVFQDTMAVLVMMIAQVVR